MNRTMMIRLNDEQWVNLGLVLSVRIVNADTDDAMIDLLMVDGTVVQIEDAPTYNALLLWLTNNDIDVRGWEENDGEHASQGDA